MPRKITKSPTKSSSKPAGESMFKKKYSLSNFELKKIALPVIIVLVIILLGFARNQIVAANVNGEQISRLEVISELESKNGKQVLEAIVTEKLIDQEAKKKKINISDKELDDEMKKIEKSVSDQGQKLDDLLALQGLTREELKSQVKTQIILKKLSGEIKVEDKEVNDYIEQNKDSIPADADMNEIRTQAKAQLEQQKLNDKIQALVTELQKNSKIEYYRYN